MDNQHTTLYDQDGRPMYTKPSDEDRMFSMLIFLLNFFAPIVGPLIIWLIKHEKSPYVNYYGKEYFNLLISFFVYEIIAAISIFVLVGFILVPIVSIAFLILIIVGAIKAYQGEYYQLPFIFRIIK